MVSRSGLHLLFRVVGDVLPGDDDASGVGLEEPHDVVQRDRFTHAAAAEDADGLGGHHVETDVLEHLLVAERLGDVAKLDVGRGLGIIRHAGQ